MTVLDLVPQAPPEPARTVLTAREEVRQALTQHPGVWLRVGAMPRGTADHHRWQINASEGVYAGGRFEATVRRIKGEYVLFARCLQV